MNGLPSNKNEFIYQNFLKISLEEKMKNIKGIAQPQYQSDKYQSGYIATVDRTTTIEELSKLFEFGVRTLFVRLGFATPTQLEEIMSQIQLSIKEFNKRNNFNIPIGLAFEMKSKNLRSGRIRNDKILFIKIGECIELTADMSYENLCVKEVLYITNLIKYIPLLKINDIIFMNMNKIQLRVIKITNSITCCIEKGKEIRSYMDVTVPYYITNLSTLTMEDMKNIQYSINNKADFIVIPSVCSSSYLQQIKDILQVIDKNIRVFCEVDEYISRNENEIQNIIKISDGVWVYNYFEKKANEFSVSKFTNLLIELSEKWMKPIIAKISVKRTYDLAKLEVNSSLKNIDSILLEKNDSLTYSYYVKSLFTSKLWTKNENYLEENESTSQHAIEHSINITNKTIPCQSAIIVSKAGNTVIRLSRNLACPIIAVVRNETLGKYLNIHKNIKAIVYKEDTTEEKEVIQYGIDFIKTNKLLNTGHFYITFYNRINNKYNACKYGCHYIPMRNITIKTRK